MPGKASWLDSCNQESYIHITNDDLVTLCGHQFAACFEDHRWKPYRVSKRRGLCRKCLTIALAQQLNFKVWSSIIPERVITEIPNRTNWRKEWENIENKLRHSDE